MKKMTTTEIKKLTEVESLGLTLDRHEKIPSFMKKGEEFVSVNKYKFVWNIDKARVSNSVNINYQIIQHRDIFTCVYGGLNNLKLDVHGWLDNYGDLVSMDLIFKGLDKVDDGEKGIDLGIRVMNSNNKSSSFRLEMFAYRSYNDTRMALGDTIPDVKDMKIHFGINVIDLEYIKAMTERFVKKVINNSGALQKLVSNCMADSIEWEVCEAILKNSIKSKKFMREIAKTIGVNVVEAIDHKTKKVKWNFICEPKKQINRWDLYNAVTSIISHDLQLKRAAQVSLEKNSRDYLKYDFIKLKEMYMNEDI